MVVAGSTIVSSPEPAAQSGQVAASLLALMMASRIEQLPSVTSASMLVVTTIVAADAALAAGPAIAATTMAPASRLPARRSVNENMSALPLVAPATDRKRSWAQ